MAETDFLAPKKGAFERNYILNESDHAAARIHVAHALIRFYSNESFAETDLRDAYDNTPYAQTQYALHDWSGAEISESPGPQVANDRFNYSLNVGQIDG